MRPALAASPRSPWRRLFWVFPVLFALVLFGARVAPARAASVAVDCTANSGALASALAGGSDGDTLNISGTCDGIFEIAHSLTLSGSSGATLDAQGAGTVLTVDAGKTVAVRNLTITGGGGNAPHGLFNAGGIDNSGTLTLTNSSVTGNSITVPQFANGVGGIFNSGSLTLIDSTVNGNSAGATLPFDTAVGGIVSGGVGPVSLTLIASTVSRNTASTPSDAFGGISMSNSVTLINSTVSGNSASATGGASAFAAAVGGILNSGGQLTVTASTLAGNSESEPNGPGPFQPPAGGLGNYFGGTLTVSDSMIAESVGPNCFGVAAASDSGYNLDDGATCGFSTANNSLSNTNPLLAGLANNGGPTMTMALEPGSPAIDAIPSGVNGCGTTITTDQRGTTRPQGSGCDIGAFEVMGDSTAPVITVPGAIAVNATSPSGAAVTYSVSATDPDDAVASLNCVPASGSTFPIGTTTVTCVASDTHGNSSSATFTVHVKGATEQLADLAAAVAGVGPGTSLADKVSHVESYLTSNDKTDACSTLTAFSNQVKAQTGKTIPASEATTLIGDALQVKTLLGC